MIEFMARIFGNEDLMPHGVCFLWRPELLWLHVVSDLVIALAYFSIPFALLVFVRRRRDLAFRSIFVLFSLFIFACGATHMMGIWVLWHADYGTQGLVKLVTAVVSLATAILLWRIIPQAVAIPSSTQLERANRTLAEQIEERHKAESAVRALNAELEARVAARTAELEAANESLRRAVQQRDVLLQEVHHRVKNNLQVISSLLTLQARKVGPDYAAHIKESVERVLTMGRVHDQLVPTESDEGFDVSVYLKRLCGDVARIYSAGAAQVTCSVEAEPIRIGLEQATPFVLIVNEVLSNGFKHGFGGRPSGTIRIEARREGEDNVLVIADDGVGLPADYRDRPRSLGITLIHSLAQQLNGQAIFESVGGTRFTLRFPHSEGTVVKTWG